MDIRVNTSEKLYSPHILVVDNDPVLLRITGQVIENLGYQVTTAGEGNETITRIKETPCKFDVILTDYALPVINGIELAEMIKELSVDLPIILYSGRIDLLDKKLIASAGIAGLARKPCSMDELDSIIKRVVYGGISMSKYSPNHIYLKEGLDKAFDTPLMI